MDRKLLIMLAVASRLAAQTTRPGPHAIARSDATAPAPVRSSLLWFPVKGKPHGG